MDFKNFKDDIKDKAAAVNESLNGVKEGGKEKFLDYINSLSDIIPVIASVGYRLTGVDIVVTLPPGVSMQFVKQEIIPKEKIDEIIETNKSNELLISIIKALVMADGFHNKIKMGNLQLIALTVNLTLPPKVTIKFG